MSSNNDIQALDGKWYNIAILAASALLAMGLWFSASAVLPQLTEEWGLSDSQKAWMTMSVQIGFVVGALLSAVSNISDRISVRRLFTLSALSAALFNLAIPLLNPSPEVAIFLRFMTGMFLAGVYPPGMKLMATWCKEDLGLGIGILVGAITIGSALPHLLNAIPLLGAEGIPGWKNVLYFSSFLAVTGALLAQFFLKAGPYLRQTAPFDWRYISKILLDRPTRLANFGYLGHMWELYAMWTWLPLFLILSYRSAGWSEQSAQLLGFSVIAVGGLGSVLAGKYADRLGRTKLTSWSMVISGSCALTIGFFFQNPMLMTIIALIWGFTVVADSAQFSAAVSELSDPRYVGTTLALQTSMGFLLTMISIRLIPVIADNIGWNFAFIILVAGPIFGTISMLKLRKLPEALKMASGNR
ncbi:MFS transporter [Candidatus Marinimicrobia bacterium MT.SAG.3]|nr:MFS transporter [Candidatus Marinimicrobia bacterium MT.SAG.3]